VDWNEDQFLGTDAVITQTWTATGIPDRADAARSGKVFGNLAIVVRSDVRDKLRSGQLRSSDWPRLKKARARRRRSTRVKSAVY
jgi:hypothetical protein